MRNSLRTLRTPQLTKPANYNSAGSGGAQHLPTATLPFTERERVRLYCRASKNHVLTFSARALIKCAHDRSLGTALGKPRVTSLMLTASKAFSPKLLSHKVWLYAPRPLASPGRTDECTAALSLTGKPTCKSAPFRCLSARTRHRLMSAPAGRPEASPVGPAAASVPCGRPATVVAYTLPGVTVFQNC